MSTTTIQSSRGIAALPNQVLSSVILDMLDGNELAKSACLVSKAWQKQVKSSPQLQGKIDEALRKKREHYELYLHAWGCEIVNGKVQRYYGGCW